MPNTAILSMEKTSPKLRINVAKVVNIEQNIWLFNMYKWRTGVKPRPYIATPDQ